jgi:hypothetical protein
MAVLSSGKSFLHGNPFCTSSFRFRWKKTEQIPFTYLAISTNMKIKKKTPKKKTNIKEDGVTGQQRFHGETRMHIGGDR